VASENNIKNVKTIDISLDKEKGIVKFAIEEGPSLPVDLKQDFGPESVSPRAEGWLKTELSKKLKEMVEADKITEDAYREIKTYLMSIQEQGNISSGFADVIDDVNTFSKKEY